MLLIDGMQYSFDGEEYTVIAQSQTNNTVFVMTDKYSGVEQFGLNHFVSEAVLLVDNYLTSLNMVLSVNSINKAEELLSDYKLYRNADLIICPSLNIYFKLNYNGEHISAEGKYLSDLFNETNNETPLLVCQYKVNL